MKSEVVITKAYGLVAATLGDLSGTGLDEPAAKAALWDDMEATRRRCLSIARRAQSSMGPKL